MSQHPNQSTLKYLNSYPIIYPIIHKIIASDIESTIMGSFHLINVQQLLYIYQDNGGIR